MTSNFDILPSQTIMERASRSWAEDVQSIFSELGYVLPETFRRGRSLDIGCGSGYLTRYLQYAGVDAYGIDSDRNAIEYGIKHYNLRNPEKLVVASMTHLPFRGETFYTVTSCNISDVVNGSLGTRIPFSLGEKAKASMEIYRVLKRGGLYIAYDVHIPFDLPQGMKLLHEYLPNHPVLRIWQKK